MQSTEVIDCNGPPGSKVTVLKRPEEFPHLNHRRQLHQSIILDNRYLFIFFGMKDEVLLSETIEYLDLRNTSKGFKEIQIESREEIASSRYFDRSLYITKGDQLKDGVDILIFGGFRGDY